MPFRSNPPDSGGYISIIVSDEVIRKLECLCEGLNRDQRDVVSACICLTWERAFDGVYVKPYLPLKVGDTDSQGAPDGLPY